MSFQHHMIAVTGSAGAGTSTAREVFVHICSNVGVTPGVIEGNSFRKYTRAEMYDRIKVPNIFGRRMTHFSPEKKLFECLEKLFREYGEQSTGHKRLYPHTEEEAIDNSFNIKTNQFVMPADKMVYVIETLLTPIIRLLVDVRMDLKQQVG